MLCHPKNFTPKAKIFDAQHKYYIAGNNIINYVGKGVLQLKLFGKTRFGDRVHQKAPTIGGTFGEVSESLGFLREGQAILQKWN